MRVLTFDAYAARSPIRFPPTLWAQDREIGLRHSVFVNPAAKAPAFPRPFSRFEIVSALHTEGAPEWPLAVDVALAIKGLRRSCHLSQIAFAERIAQSRVTVERWEAGASRPLRGRIHELLSALRPLVHDQLSAGQFLGVASVAVCPALTRPAGTYTRGQLIDLLRQGRHDHRAVGPALLEALVGAHVLTELDPDNDGATARFIATAGLAVVDQDEGPWDAEARRVLRSLTEEDARLWLEVGRKLGSTDACETT